MSSTVSQPYDSQNETLGNTKFSNSKVAIQWKAVEQYFAVALFVFEFDQVCNFGKLINFRLGTVRSERITLSL